MFAIPAIRPGWASIRRKGQRMGDGVGTISRADVIGCYYDFLGRIPESEAAVQYFLDACATVETLREAFRNSPEYQARSNPELPAARFEMLEGLDALDGLMIRAARSGDEQARVAMLCRHCLARPPWRLPHDPFSRAYRDAVLAAHQTVRRGQAYEPALDERIDITDCGDRARRPGIYRDGNSRHLGIFLEAIGQILQVADVGSEARVLEYGPGDGQLSLQLARMGCDVTVVDIEPRYLAIVRLQAEAFGRAVRTIEGPFTTPIEGSFDTVLFFEAFHHALDHFVLLESLHDRVAPEGRIIFGGEPILPADDYWAPTVPYPWGLRLDALSLSAVRHYGWMELGFTEAYFFELLARTGWRGRKVTSLSNGRGTCYIAEH
jgi:SAM-dependent methyltransferase